MVYSKALKKNMITNTEILFLILAQIVAIIFSGLIVFKPPYRPIYKKYVVLDILFVLSGIISLIFILGVNLVHMIVSIGKWWNTLK